MEQAPEVSGEFRDRLFGGDTVRQGINSYDSTVPQQLKNILHSNIHKHIYLQIDIRRCN